MGKHWRIFPHDADRIARLENTAEIPAVVAQLLVCRGILDPGDARQFLDAKLANLRDPELLPGIKHAADRIHAAIQSGHRITIYGDYDADGMTATAILWRCLKLLGADVDFYVRRMLTQSRAVLHKLKLFAGGEMEKGEQVAFSRRDFPHPASTRPWQNTTALDEPPVQLLQLPDQQSAAHRFRPYNECF